MVPYIILEPDARWSGEFRTIGATLREHLGPRAIRIDHIGSTAVPGLPAKDIIDVQVTVAALEPEEPIVSALDAAGYVWLEDYRRDHQPPGSDTPDREWQKLMFRSGSDQRRTNVHVRVDGRLNQRYPLLFRDYLRAHPPAAAAYSAVKRQLALRSDRDVELYYDVKDPVCDIIMVAAGDWAAATEWRLGPSDA